MSDAAWLLKSTDARDADGVYRTALIALKQGLAEQAVPLARSAADLHPQDARMWQVLALAYRGLDDLAPALDAIERAAALAPHDALIAHTLARTAFEAGLPSLHLFDPARRLAPEDNALLLNHVAAYWAEGATDTAIALLDERVIAQPGWLEGHVTLARLRWMSGARDAFTTSFDTALATAPQNVDL